jgi:RNA polymerase sigma factor (sigma-70 family)
MDHLMNGSAADGIRDVSGAFPGTHWSAVVAAGREGSPNAEAALAELCGTYWYPLYAFARRKGHQPADAQDLTQGFFTHFIDSQLVVKANPEKGRFRSFLMGCFVNFMASEKERAQALKRGGRQPVIPLDPQQAEVRLAQELSPGASPERLFDRHWALAVLDAALVRLESEFKKSGREQLFQQLQPFLQGDTSGPGYAEVAQRLGTTEGTISVTVHRLRQRYRELLRVVVSQTVNSPLEVDAELAHLMAALRG